MPDVTTQLKQFTSRYQMALIAKAAVLGALALGIAGTCWWRLHLLRASPWWSLGLPTALILASVAGLAWWLRLRWISVHAAADRLDNTLGLQQRLVTTLEFAGTQPSPALYPQLVDDTTHVFASQKVRVPRPVGRATLGAAVVLLLLLLWPFQGTEPIRLAGLPGMPPSTPPPQPETPPPQPETPPSQDQQQDQQQQSPESRQGEGEQTQQDQQQTGKQADRRDSRSGKDDQQTSQGQQGQSDQQGQTGQQDRQGQQGQQSQQGQQRQQGQQAGGSDQQTQQDLAKAAASASSHGQQSPGGQDALKADIQQLLKELSGELKDLQEQLAAAELPTPEAGTSTDEQLYGAPEPLAQTNGSALPIQLKTDTAETDAARPGGGGVGQPSGEISGDAPQAQPEAAQLAEESLEDAAVSRQRVPPEYQSVFDRLYQRTAQPSETTTP